MAINIPSGNSDEVIDRIIAVLQQYETDHPQAQIDLYRQNSVSVRVRFIDAGFAGQTKLQCSQQVWKFLGQLSEDVQGDTSTLLLLAPDERKMSFANFVFDDPIPSKL
jgi:hypothetical protein